MCGKLNYKEIRKMENKTKYKVPAKYQEAIKSIYEDDDGIWIKLNEGWEGEPGCTIIHEENWAGARNSLAHELKKI